MDCWGTFHYIEVDDVLDPCGSRCQCKQVHMNLVDQDDSRRILAMGIVIEGDDDDDD